MTGEAVVDAVALDAVVLEAVVFDAVVLAGGTARRLGGVSKPDVPVAGRPLLDHVLDAVGGARRVVVVGPSALARPGVFTALEDPPDGGPVAGIAAGVAALATLVTGEDVADVPGVADVADVPGVPVLVLACDLPLVGRAVPLLLAALVAAPDADGAGLVDADGRAQIALLVRGEALRAALGRLGAVRGEPGVRGASVRRLSAELVLVPVADPAGLGADADTWDDVRRLDSLIRAGGTMTEPHDVPAAGSPDGPGPAGSELHRWVLSTAEDLGVDPDVLDVDLLLDLSRDVAHTVMRPAVPLTSFLVGYAVASAGGDRAALERVVARATDLARRWDATHGTGA